MRFPRPLFVAIASITLAQSAARAADDQLIADFEAASYGNWTATGNAFGNGPAEGTLPNQMHVDGYQGQRLASSYVGGDGTQGTLTSPKFEIARDYISFLVGGGSHPNKTCVNLIVDGRIVQTTPGADDEHLDWFTWDVRSLRGKQAQVQVVDRETGGWGHISVDQIMQTDHPPVPPAEHAPLYAERFRPQFHFTSATNWINDPNGCVFFDGEYHLFFQHNPSGNQWGNMTWGHAVSPDLLHWKQLPDAIKPDALGTIFSGSAVVDTNNTSGFGTGNHPPLVAMYTAAGGTNPESKGKPFTQCIAYSNDRGRTWIKYPHNPVIQHIAGENRDPKVIWHEPTHQWIVALYLDRDQYALFSSPDLKTWTKLQDVTMAGRSECPDFFPLAIDGDTKQTKWVLTSADASYLIGDFDGHTFTPSGEPQRVDFGRNNYAVQTFSNVPDGRRIQIGWLRDGHFPRMPFNGQMNFPSTLELRSTPAGPRFFRNPIREIETLHDGTAKQWQDLQLAPGAANPLSAINGDLLHIRATIRPGNAAAVGFAIRGQRVVYHVPEHRLEALGDTSVELQDGKLTLEILVDRTTIETFANNGIAAASSCYLPQADAVPLSLFCEGGSATIESLQIWNLKSVWSTQAATTP